MKRVIQIGANIGHNDPVYDLVASGYWALLVEPVPRTMDALKQRYKEFADRVVFDQVAVSDRAGMALFYVDNYETACSCHASLSLDFQYKHGHGNGRDIITTIEVECVTLHELFKRHRLLHEEIDMLVIDAEGHDAVIILSTDFSKLNVRKIVFERVHTDGPCKQGEVYQQVLGHLRLAGYGNFCDVGPWDTVGERTHIASPAKEGI